MNAVITHTQLEILEERGPAVRHHVNDTQPLSTVIFGHNIAHIYKAMPDITLQHTVLPFPLYASLIIS